MGKGVCRECGAAMSWSRKPKIFCNAACRSAHTNRRRERGAQLYDLFMAVRYDRETARETGAWTKLCRMAESFHDADIIEGRNSAIPVRQALAQHSHLNATKLVKRRPEYRGGE